MKRRDLLTAAGIGAAAVALSGCQQKECDPAAAGDASTEQQTFEWKLVTSWPKNFPGLGMAPERLAQMVSAMTNGRFKIKVYGGGELVPPLEVFDAVSRGTAQMGHSGAYYWKGKVPAAQFFTSVPFGLTAQEINAWITYGGGQALWEEIYQAHNIYPLPGGNTGVQMAGWFNKEINSIDDLKGLKMRIPGLGGEVLKRVGGTPVNIPGGELFTALQTGAIDATEWVGPYNDLAFGFHKAAKFCYYPGWHEPGSMMEFSINKTALEALPAEYQEILKVACKAVNQDMLDEYTARNNAALSELINTHNVEVRRLPDEVLAKLKQESDLAVQEAAAGDPLAKKVYDSFIAFRDGVSNWHKLSEQAYINARSM